jgi:hypothetical protein
MVAVLGADAIRREFPAGSRRFQVEEEGREGGREGSGVLKGGR